MIYQWKLIKSKTAVYWYHFLLFKLNDEHKWVQWLRLSSPMRYILLTTHQRLRKKHRMQSGAKI